MDTLTVSAAVSAVVSVLVGTLLNWGERVVSGLRRCIPPDHKPLWSGGGSPAGRADSMTDQVRVLVCCAPNRSLRRREVDPDAAIRFVRERLPGLFPPEPVFSMPGHGVRFERPGGHEYAWVHTSGRIDLCVEVPTTPVEPGPVTVSVLDLIGPVLAVLEAVRGDAYDVVFGRCLPGMRRRFDWAVAVSQTVTVPSRGSVSWQELEFPGRRPPRAGTNQQAFCPPGGYAASGLRNWRLRRPAADLVRVVLRDLLHQNGYHGVDTAISDVIALI